MAFWPRIRTDSIPMRPGLFVLSIVLALSLGLCDSAMAQCEDQYDWAVWDDFSGFTATGSITNNNGTYTVTMEANYWFDYTVNIFNYGAFNGFNGPLPPNATVPRTTWAAGQGGVTTMCFSETVTNPVLLLSSLGSPGIIVTLEFSVPYSVVFDGGGMTYPNNTTIIGQEGYAILVFPGDFDCVTIYSSTPENYTNLTWGLNPPPFEVEISGDTIACVSTTLTASGGVSYQWSGGNTPNSPGNSFTESGQYFVTVTDANGCTVVDSTNIVIHPDYVTEEDATICSGESYDFHGQTLDQPGIYEIPLLSEHGCDSLVSLNLIVLPQSQEEWTVSICEGEGFPFDQTLLTESGTYYAQLQNVFGCDSLITLHLEVRPSTFLSLSATICQGESYFFDGSNLSSGGNYLATLEDQFGCDSLVSLDLEVLPAALTQLYDTICGGDYILFQGDTLNQPGIYTASFPDPAGCDSLVILDLAQRPVHLTPVRDTVCTGTPYLFHGDSLLVSGTYTHLLQNAWGCDSTIQLELWVHPARSSGSSATVCEGTPYPFYGTDLFQSGVYSITFPDQWGCDSLVTLDLTVHPYASTAIEVQICQGQQYLFQGDTLTEPGHYLAQLQTVTGCDSTVQLTLTAVSVIETPLSATICLGETFPFGGRLLTQSGLYRDTLISAGGCDSIAVLNLEVASPQQSAISAMICAGEVLDFHGQMLTQSGAYSVILLTQAGCDSTVTLELTVLAPVLTDLQAQICSGQTYPFFGQDLQAPGTYTGTLPSWTGCDSLVLLDLTVTDLIRTDLQGRICEGESYAFGAASLTAGGIYSDTLVSAGGCDSLVVLQLQVDPQPLTVLDAGICAGERFPFDGQLLDQAGTYTTVLPASGGCDSLVQLELQVFPVHKMVLEAEECERYFWTETRQWYTQSGTYSRLLQTARGCDSLLTLQLRILDGSVTQDTVESRRAYSWPVNGTEYTQSGIYQASFANAEGCDSIHILHLTLLPDPGLYVPSAFSPNGDGINDGFTLYGGEDLVRIEEMRIYDRWGNALSLIADIPPGDPGQGWDGTGRGKILDPGVYVFTARVLFNDGTIRSLHGEVILVR